MKSFLLLLLVSFYGGSLLAGGRPEPQAQLATFFKDLSERGGASALKELCEGTFLERQKGIQLETYSPQLDTALKLYGKISRMEYVEKKPFGESFVRLRLISYHASGAPLFWEFMFFRAKDEWELYVFRFNDQIHRVFSDSP